MRGGPCNREIRIRIQTDFGGAISHQRLFNTVTTLVHRPGTSSGSAVTHFPRNTSNLDVRQRQSSPYMPHIGLANTLPFSLFYISPDVLTWLSLPALLASGITLS